MKALYITIITALILLTGGFYYLKNTQVNNVSKQVLTFEDCLKAGNLVMESYPRQCKTEDGKTFVEEIAEKITYENATENNIQVELPYPGAVTGKEFSVIGKARGNWYFEASFPVTVLDKDGNKLFEAPAQAQGEWMTEDFVPFKIDIKVPESYIGKATLVLKKDNPSGESRFDASISFPINIEY